MCAEAACSRRLTMLTGSQHNQYEQNTSDQLERYKLLVDNVEDYAIFLLDNDGIIISWNRGAELMKGYKPREIIGKHFSTFYIDEDIKKNKPARALEYSKTHGSVENEGWRLRKDGSQFWANAIIRSLYDKKGEHKGYAKIIRDLTQRKIYEDKLNATNLKLSTSYVELQKLNESKDEFVSLASHQLRTPATGVKQYIALILEGYMGPITERQRDCLQKAYESNDRQIEIINDLLQVAQLDAGKVELKKSLTDIVELIEDVIDEQIDFFKNRQQKITLSMQKNKIVLNLDPVRFRMVVENLIDNASKYTPLKGEITVSAVKKGKYCKISVEDTGVGISKEDSKKLFEKFTRLSNPLTKDISGSGLGLYWAQKIVRLHKGRITIESQPGIGTTFNILMPLEKHHA